MTYQQVADMIQEMATAIGKPDAWAYYTFADGTAEPCPFIVFYYPNSADEFADGQNYHQIKALNIEVYTNNKDFDIEAQVRVVLDSHGMVYTLTESYLEGEKMYEQLYEMEVIING